MTKRAKASAPGALRALFVTAPGIDPAKAALDEPQLRDLRERMRLGRLLPRGAAPGGAAEKTLIALEKANGRDDILPFAMLAKGCVAGRGVCLIDTDDGRPGTGFLVARDVLLTAHHVLDNPAKAAAARCRFDFELDANGVEKPSVSFRLDPTALFISSPIVQGPGGLDYTFVRIDGAAGDQFGWLAPSRGSSKISEGEPANLIHHPDGLRKMVTLQDNRVAGDQGLMLKYLSDTEGGSSGAPVYNNDWDVVGLHYGSEAAAEGEVDMRGHAADNFNLAVKLSAIAVDLERRLEVAEDAGDAAAALALFRDTDSLLGGYFGAIGRVGAPGEPPLDQVAALYDARADLDIGFLDASAVAGGGPERVGAMARLMAELGLDVYMLAGCGRAVARQLVKRLKALEFGTYEAPPDAWVEGHATPIWNRRWVTLAPRAWEAGVRGSFAATGGVAPLNGFEGPLFDHAPGLFTVARGGMPDIDLASLWFSQGDIGGARRALATKVLGIALGRTLGAGACVVAGGCVPAEVAAADWPARFGAGASVTGAAGEGGKGLALARTAACPPLRLWTQGELEPLPGAKRAPARPAIAALAGAGEFKPLLARLSLVPAGAAAGVMVALDPAVAAGLA